MILSRFTLKNLSDRQLRLPIASIFTLPEKILQFGTGVLLRGLPDFFVDEANNRGLFNGRIVVVKSTAHGDTSAFEKQDGLYTVCTRGIKNGIEVAYNTINASISRVLNATEEWHQVLDCAHNHHLQIIISNTTEVGIQLVQDDIRKHPPVSFPGKLLAFLYERFKAFGNSHQSGFVIVPTELIPENGRKLKSIVLELAHLNQLEDSFLEWLGNSNYFCNSLVDRIVPGKPDQYVLDQLEKELGYEDQLLVVAEEYRLWAIEGDSKIQTILSFSEADQGVIITRDINIFRELKLRLLNGTHTLTCGLAFLMGCRTVREAMQNPQLSSYISHLMQDEICNSIPYPVEPAQAMNFCMTVLDRFRNLNIEHAWINITMQYTMKMELRIVPVIKQHYESGKEVPELMATGFAAYIIFSKPVIERNNEFFGIYNGSEYKINDDQALKLLNIWKGKNLSDVVPEILSDISLWKIDLSLFKGFTEEVLKRAQMIMNNDFTFLQSPHETQEVAL